MSHILHLDQTTIVERNRRPTISTTKGKTTIAATIFAEKTEDLRFWRLKVRPPFLQFKKERPQKLAKQAPPQRLD